MDCCKIKGESVFRKAIFVLFSLFFTNILSAGVYCKYLSSCKEACYYYKQGYYRLDRDRDGIPCENLCSGPCSSSVTQKKKHKHYNRKSYHKTKYVSKYNQIHHRERYYQREFCKKVLGIMEYKLSDNTRIDCYTSTYSFEVDFAKKAYEAIGQALHYADKIKNKPGIVLIVEKKRDMHYVNSIKHTAKKYKIKIFTIDSNLKIKVVK